MSSPRAAPDDSAVPAAEVRACLDKILNSKTFINSKRLCKFLEFTVERTLAGKSNNLKEYALGRDVFERGDDYDPRTDSIVRVEAQRLRRKLKQYSEDAGREDRVVIRFRPG